MRKLKDPLPAEVLSFDFGKLLAAPHEITPKEAMFYDNPIWLVEHEGDLYFVVKHICKGIKLDWDNQQKVIRGHPVLESTKVIITLIPPNAKRKRSYPYVCLPVARLNFWLSIIHPDRYKADPYRRDQLILYQTECADYLADVWLEGSAVRIGKKSPFRLIEDRMDRLENSHCRLKQVVMETISPETSSIPVIKHRGGPVLVESPKDGIEYVHSEDGLEKKKEHRTPDNWEE